MIARRGVLTGLLAAPAIIRTPGLLMPVKAAAAAPMFYNPWVEELRAKGCVSYNWAPEIPFSFRVLFVADADARSGWRVGDVITLSQPS